MAANLEILKMIIFIIAVEIENFHPRYRFGDVLIQEKIKIGQFLGPPA